MHSSSVSLKDLIRAFFLLQPDNICQAAIAELLGFESEAKQTFLLSLSNEPIKEEIQNATAPESVPESVAESETLSRVNIASSFSETQKDRLKPLRILENEEKNNNSESGLFPSLIPSEIKFISQDSFPTNIGVKSIPKPATGESSFDLDFESLVSERSSRVIILAVLSTMSREGDVDLRQIIEHIVQNKSVDILPRYYLPTLRRGVQLLIDVGEAMMPYRRDQIVLQSRIRAVVDSDGTSILRFIGTPLKGVKDGYQFESRQYELPRLGTPVLLLTDLGIGQPLFSEDPATASEWIEFANIVKANKSPLIAFVPYHKRRWPSELLPLIQTVYWDRATLFSEVRKKMGRGHILSE